jgi:hypothetical protein
VHFMPHCIFFIICLLFEFKFQIQIQMHLSAILFLPLFLIGPSPLPLFFFLSLFLLAAQPNLAFLLPFSFSPRGPTCSFSLAQLHPCGLLLFPFPFRSLTGGPHLSGPSPSPSKARTRFRVQPTPDTIPRRAEPRARTPRCLGHPIKPPSSCPRSFPSRSRRLHPKTLSHLSSSAATASTPRPLAVPPLCCFSASTSHRRSFVVG